MARFRRVIPPLLAASIVVHAAIMGAMWQRHGRLDAYAFASADAREYHTLARNLAHHGRFSQDLSAPRQPDTWRTPGYPAFLAVIMTLSRSDSPVPPIVVQQLLGVINVCLLGGIAATYTTCRRAIAMGLLFLFEPYHHLYSWWLMSTTLFVTVLLLTWLAWQRAVDRGRRWGFAWAGVLSGVAVLLRPLALPLPVFAAVGIPLAAAPGTRRRMVAGGVVLVLCAGILAGAWAGRNHQVAGRWALSHQSGTVLAYFKAAEVVLWRQDRTAQRYLETSLDPQKADLPHTVWEDIDARLRNRLAHLPADRLNELQWTALARGEVTGTNPFTVSDALSAIGWELLTADPLSTAACYAVRGAGLLTFPLGLALRPPEGASSAILKDAALGLLYTALLLWAVFRAAAGGARSRLSVFPVLCIAALLLASTPQLDPRFRAPMLPFLIFIALLRPRPEASPTLRAD